MRQLTKIRFKNDYHFANLYFLVKVLGLTLDFSSNLLKTMKLGETIDLEEPKEIKSRFSTDEILEFCKEYGIIIRIWNTI